ncbi:unnamed protein product [Symbiodinium sp. CCMP2592]|nr:unnamed protein product [Symbiodinium sp. CCMP2592]
MQQTVRASATHCHDCGPGILAQKTHAPTGLRYCKRCYTLLTNPTCLLCNEPVHSSTQTLAPVVCAETTCSRIVLLCQSCVALSTDLPCHLCAARLYTGKCCRCKLSLPPVDAALRVCRSCTNAALSSVHCQFCASSLASSFQPSPCECSTCAEADKALESYTCNSCHAVVDAYFSPACVWREKPSWYRKGRCLRCRNKASSVSAYYCINCFRTATPDGRTRQLRIEAALILEKTAGCASLPTKAPAIQHLLRWPSSATLEMPDYKPRVELLSGNHCRLCFSCFPTEACPTALHEHLQSAHGLSPKQYRKQVLDEAARGLRPVPAQRLRARLAAYQQVVSGGRANWTVCASCARAKPLCKTSRITLGLPKTCPAWLKWSDSAWERHGANWFQALDCLFDTATYFHKYFAGPDRLTTAQEEVDAALAAYGLESFEYKHACKWLQRVQLWAKNVQRALDADAVPAPHRFGNVHVFPQRGGEISRALGDLRNALNWYCSHNWEWLVATRADGEDAASSAVIDGQVEDATPLGLWTAAMKKYNVLLACEEALAAGAKTPPLQQARNKALWEAVKALQRLASDEVRMQLDDFERSRQSQTLTLCLPTETTLLDDRQPEFWSHCFCDLFYRADCWERPAVAKQRLHGRKWLRCLMKRVDFVGLRMVFVQDTLNTLSTADFVAAAQSAQCNVRSMAAALQSKAFCSSGLHTLFREMTIVLQDVDGTEAQRGSWLYKMRALRVWHGCSFLFFTLNPSDHKNPLFMSFLAVQDKSLTRVDLGSSDDAQQDFVSRHASQDAFFFRTLAAKYPRAAMRCIRFVMERTIDTLMYCAAPANKKPTVQHVDLVAAKTEPGVWQHVSAYFGVVETTKSMREHLHVLVHLLGFSHPSELLRGNFRSNFRSVWRYIASVCFHSEEAFARYCGTDAGLEALRRQPLLPVTHKQAALLGPRAAEAVHAQKTARGVALESVNASDIPDGPHETWRPWPGSYYADLRVSPEQWARQAACHANAAAILFGNHVCLPHVCYKRKSKRKAFCRMLYWHWKLSTNSEGRVTATRVHGLPLQPPLDVDACPVQTMQPHQGPSCNHDLSVLFRFGSTALPSEDDCDDSTQSQVLLDDMLQTITDHEYYTGGYLVKGNDAAQDLLHCLHDAKQQHERHSAASDVASVDNAKTLFRRLILALNKRYRVGFQTVYAYLFGKPAYYTSHTFVPLSLTAVLARCEAAIAKGFREPWPKNAQADNPSECAVEPPCSRAPTYTAYDYQWRPSALADFPWYFFAAGTDVSAAAGLHALPWPVLHDAQGRARHHPAYERRLQDHRFVVRSSTVRTLGGELEPLLDDAGQVLRWYDHYRTLRTHKAVQDWSGVSAFAAATSEDVWMALDHEYRRWRQELQQASEALRGGAAPLFNTASWWTLMVWDKLRNFELTCLRKTYKDTNQPRDDTGQRIQEDEDTDNSEHDSQCDRASSGSRQGEDGPEGAPDNVPNAPVFAPTSEEARKCGDVAATRQSHLVYAEPALGKRGLEKLYAQNFLDCNGFCSILISGA